MKNAIIVGLGAMVGAILRYGLLAKFPLNGFPWTVALINISGSFLLGFLTGYFAGRVEREAPIRLLLGTGIMGGYTTYSTFSMDVIEQIQNGRVLPALYNVTLQTVGSIALCALGFVLGHKLNPSSTG